MRAVLPPAHVFWLFGLSGAGKSTLAESLAVELRRDGRGVLALDGDDLRSGLCRGLGFSDEDRAENLRRAAEVAKLGLASDLCVVASFITPLQRHREIVSEVLSPRISFIYVDAPLSVCRARDVKGLYARAGAGGVAHMTGVSSGFEAPTRYDLRIPTGEEGAADSAGRLCEFARTRLSSL
jgi:adenylyl-sulfate kinase